ncbi:MAG: hypothetical protein Kow00107_02370 [Planctomycetota bacterium]
MLRTQDLAITSIHEVESAVGKIGRVESPLDPAPISMVETVINYHPEYLQDSDGNVMLFSYDADSKDLFRTVTGEPVLAPDGKPYYVPGRFLRGDDGRLIPDENGMPFRLWRPELRPDLNPGRTAWAGIKKPEDIWDQIVMRAETPGATSAPFLQPIETRIVMLQTGMRAPMGVKLFGKGKVTLEELEEAGIRIEELLREVPEIRPETVNAERIVGKPYLELVLDRSALELYGLTVDEVQKVIMASIGGLPATMTVEGRERYSVLVRYLREFRDSPEAIARTLVKTPSGANIPLSDVLEEGRPLFRRGPMAIKGEEGALVSYVLFDSYAGKAEVEVVEKADRHLKEAIASGRLTLPEGVTFKFAGTYENQVRSERRLMIILPLSLLVILIILYTQFRSISVSAFVFSGIAVAWAGGFILIWLYGQPWFMDFSIAGQSVRELFQMGEVNLSVAVWVGFIALFGIATDDGVVMATYIQQSLKKAKPASIHDAREAIVTAAVRRARPCLMTTATTILALLPVLTSTGKGSDIMVPMAIPSFGGMTIEIISMFVVPVLYAMKEEFKILVSKKEV